MHLSQEGIAGVTAGTEWLSSGAGVVVVGGKVYANGVTAGEVCHTDDHHNHSWQRNASLLSPSQTDVLTLFSPRGILLRSGDSQILLTPDRVVMTTDQLVVRDPSDHLLVLAQDHKHLITSTSVRASGPALLVFNTSIQTPSLTSLIGAQNGHRKGLRIESLTRSTRLLGPMGVHIRADTGSMLLHAHGDLRVHSKSDRVTISFLIAMSSHD